MATRKYREIEYALILNISKFTKQAKIAVGVVGKMDKEMKHALKQANLAVGVVGKMDKEIEHALKPTKKQFANLGKSLAIGVAAGVTASIFALNKLKREMFEAVGLSNVQETAEIRLAGVLRATGEAAGISLDNLKKYAADLQEITTVGDEVTLTGIAILATFKEIKGDEFKRATKAAIDMSAVMDQDLKSSIVQVGKALNDPIKGMSALSRVGVTFTDQQKDLVKQLVESGDIIGAQNIILKELESQFGRVAEALGETFGGKVKSATNAFNDLREEIGFVISKNAFFIQSADIIKGIFIEWGKQINTNAGEWRVWAKEAALAVLEFVADFGDGINLTFQVMQKLSGIMKLAAAGTLILAKGFQNLFEASNRFFGDDEKAEFWANAQIQSAKLIEEAMEGAADSFDKADKGLPFVEKATTKIRQLKDDLAKIKPEFKDAADSINDDTEEIDQEVENVGGTWANTFQKAKKEESEFFNQAMKDLRTLQAEAAKVKLGSGGAGVQGFAKGGDPFHGGLSGYGGGDRRAIMVEDGEHVIRKEAVRRLGHGFFQRFNNLRLPGFAMGGAIGAGGGGGEMTVNLSFGVGRSIPVRTSSGNAKALVSELKRMSRRSS